MHATHPFSDKYKKIASVCNHVCTDHKPLDAEQQHSPAPPPRHAFRRRGSRPSSRSGVGAAGPLPAAPGGGTRASTPSGGAAGVGGGSVALAPLFLVPSNDQRPHETTHGIRRPHMSAPNQGPAVGAGAVVGAGGAGLHFSPLGGLSASSVDSVSGVG